LVERRCDFSTNHTAGSAIAIVIVIIIIIIIIHILLGFAPVAAGIMLLPAAY
jgi:hypothetical protein